MDRFLHIAEPFLDIEIDEDPSLVREKLEKLTRCLVAKDFVEECLRLVNSPDTGRLWNDCAV
jgi:hypothetical protein